MALAAGLSLGATAAASATADAPNEAVQSAAPTPDYLAANARVAGRGARGGGFHGGRAAGSRAGGFHGGAAPRGGFPGGPVHGGPQRGGGHGGHGGFHGGGFPGWWWGAGWFGMDLYLATLPPYYQAFLWGGVPYYYVDGNYWVWNGDVDEYEQVQPPAQLAEPEQGPTEGGGLFVYPENAQTALQQSKDEAQCSGLASARTGYTPANGTAAQSGDSANQNGSAALGEREDYLRAERACLEARGYSVE